MMEKLFGAWGRFCFRRRRAVLAATALLMAASIALILRLRFESDLNTLIPTEAGKQLERIDRAFELKEQAFLIAEAEAEAAGALLAFARALAEDLERSGWIAEVEFGYEQAVETILEKLAPYGPRFAPESERPSLAQLFTPEGLSRQAARQIARLSMPGSGEAAALVARDPLDLASFLAGSMQAFRGAFRFNALSPHYLSEDNRALLIRLRGEKPVNDMAAVRATVKDVWRAVEKARGSAGAPLHVSAGGGYFLAQETESMIRRDLTLSLSTSTALVFLLIAWTVRGARFTLLFLPPLAAGFILALGIYAAFRSQIASISIGSATLLVGLGVDFAIHFLLLVKTERTRGEPLEEAVVRASREAGPGLLSAALTTIAAFLAFLASSFEFLRQMGLLTALGISTILLATVTVLPALLSRRFEGDLAGGKPPRSLGVRGAVDLAVRAPRAVLAAAFLLSAVSAAVLWISPPALESDLRNLHARDSPALAAERRLAEVFGGSSEPLLLLLEAGGEPALEKQLRRLQPVLQGLVDRKTLLAFASAAVFLPDPEGERAALKQLAALDPERARKEMLRALEEAGFDARELAPAVERAAAALGDGRPLSLSRLRELGLGGAIDRLVAHDPDRTGQVLGLATLFPADPLWSSERREPMIRAVEEALRSQGLEGSLTGLFAVSAESADLVAVELARIGGLALLAVAAIVAAQFRSPKTILLVFLPVSLGCLWTGALLKLLGTSIHFMNAAVFPMIIGIGIDDGIHTVHRYLLYKKAGKGAPGAAPDALPTIRATFAVSGTSVALTSLTTMLAFGSLAFSRNRGIASVGLLCLAGIGACLLASLTVLPAALAVLERRRGKSE